ncbi:MAG: hypothetical protein M3Y88_05680 [Chloroflexota bacterium]|nr:hypothetical protein [Chloroflexota bacterium]
MVRYLEVQGVVGAERGPGPRGHRHYPPGEVALGKAAAQAMEAGYPTATLRALRDLAARRVKDARGSGDPLAWFELLALAREVENVRRADEPRPRPPAVAHPDAAQGHAASAARRPHPPHAGRDRHLGRR